MKKIFIKTFGCQQNVADSERIAGFYIDQKYHLVNDYKKADLIVINTCVVREQAEEKIYGFVNGLKKLKKEKPNLEIVITGCLVGAAKRVTSDFFDKRMKKRLSIADKFIENTKYPANQKSFRFQSSNTIENSFQDRKNNKVDNKHAWVNISNGCSNFCAFCIVPFARGPEVSKPFNDIIDEVKNLINNGYTEITLLGQNVNSWGTDLIKQSKTNNQNFKLPNGKFVKPILVKTMGRKRIPTLFPFLLEELCQIKKLKKISFMSSNPWDFSNKLIDIITKYSQIDRTIHLPLQAGDDEILKRMNRFYTQKEYLNLIKKIKNKIKNVKFTTDIIVGFPGETDKAFKETIKVCKQVGFKRAYVARYSPRKGTMAAQKFKDNISQQVKRERYHILDKLVNKKKKTSYNL